MKYHSTRTNRDSLSFSQALRAGLATDGGLYVPDFSEQMPDFRHQQAQATIAQTATQLLATFLAGDRLAESLPAICTQALSFPIPLTALHVKDSYQLELFHGPTAAFKDVAAGFLAGCMARLRSNDDPTETIIVATSGDTGAAVAAAFHRRPGFRVVILYPDDRVSPRQAHSLGAFGDNILAFRVNGNFDDCQRLAKQALSDTQLREQMSLGTANSISLGRWLPQMVYYAHHAMAFYAQHGKRLGFVIPSGNLGHSTACLLAKKLGAPIGDAVLATNANPTLSEFAGGAAYRGRPSIATLANAMDVGDPSNFERLRWLFDNDENALRKQVRIERVDDQDIRAMIARAPHIYGAVVCPHTATGLIALERLRFTGNDAPFAVAATAHPSKFAETVESIIGHTITAPDAFAALLAKPSQAEPMDVDYQHLRDQLLNRTVSV